MAGRIKKAVTAQTITMVGATLIKLLQDEEFRQRVGEVSTSVRGWATKRKSQMALPSADQPSGLRGSFGQAALQRRITGLRTMSVDLGPEHAELARHVGATADDLQRALAVAANMPTSTRWRTLRDIGKRLDEIERALIAAVLPRSR